MKINKLIGGLALALSLGLISQATDAYAQAPNTNQNYIIETAKGGYNNSALEKATAAEIEAYESYISYYQEMAAKDKQRYEKEYSDQKLNELINGLGAEYNIRYELAKGIKSLEKVDSVEFKQLIAESIDVLNTKNLEKIKLQTLFVGDNLKRKENEFKEKNLILDYKLADVEEKEIEDKLLAYINEGKLIPGGTYNELQNLKLQQESFKASKTYNEAQDDLKTQYDEVFTKVEKEVSNKNQAVVAYPLVNEFLSAQTVEDIDKYENLIEESITNTAFNASNDQTLSTEEEESIEETSQLDNPGQMSESTNSGSAFLENEKTSTKYNELTDSLKRELDAIDTNKDGVLSDTEIDASANFQPPIPEDSWLYPFTEAGLKEDSSTTTTSQTDNQTESQTSTPQTSPATTDTDTADDTTSTSTTSTTEDKPLPNTVTIDNSETKAPELAPSEADDEDTEDQTVEDTDTDDEDEEWSESEASAEVVQNTTAASIVKTGIKGLGVVIAILAIALIAYYFMAKDKKKNR